MGLGLNIKLIGFELAVKKIRETLKKSDSALQNAVSKSALIVEGAAKKASPIKTGRLRTSITHILRKVGFGDYSAKIGTNVEYAPFLEFGTRKMKKRPFLFPALAMNFSKIQKMIGDAIKKSF